MATLVFLYGPPAVGKTTVGRMVAEQMNYRFFFNHLTVPAARAIFPDASLLHYDPRHRSLLHQLRKDALAAAAQANFDTVFTMAYSGEIDDAMVAEIVHEFTKRGGRVCFVELHAPEDVLMQRVEDPSREALHLGKMTSREHLRKALEMRDMMASVSYPDILKIDTSVLSPERSAQAIIDMLQK